MKHLLFSLLIAFAWIGVKGQRDSSALSDGRPLLRTGHYPDYTFYLNYLPDKIKIIQEYSLTNGIIGELKTKVYDDSAHKYIFLLDESAENGYIRDRIEKDFAMAVDSAYRYCIPNRLQNYHPLKKDQ